MNNFSEIIKKIDQKRNTVPKNNIGKSILWFIAANAAVVLSVSIISGGTSVEFIPYLIVWASLFPFISLLFSKLLAKISHKISIIDPNDFKNTQQESLFKLVASLCDKTDIKKMPEIGIYKSDDMNAFATGLGKNNSLIAFSSSLLEKLDDEATAAVAAHEIAHIANGDMITMTLLQSVINAIVLLITLPLSVFRLAAFFSDKISVFGYWLISLVKIIVTSILLFLGNLVVKAFSRHREFKADELAGQLTDNTYMINALKFLSTDTISFPNEQKAYAAFKINSTPALYDIFSTHPSIDRRIKALENKIHSQVQGSVGIGPKP